MCGWSIGLLCCRHHSSGCIDVTRSEFLQRKADAAECRRLAALPAKIVCTAPECPEGPLMQVRAAKGHRTAAWVHSFQEDSAT